MENKGLLLVLCIYYSIGKGDVAMDSKFKEEPLHETVSLQSGNRNSSYFVNPKQFLTYAEQFDKIKSLGAEVRCKLRGSCSNKKRSKISKKRTRTTKKFTTGRLVDKKSFEFRPSSDLPDNHNSILSPDSLSSPLSNSLLPPGVGSEYTQQPGAAVYGQQPQMNLKLPHSMDHSMGSQGSQTLDQVQNAENEASIQNSIKAKMDFMDRANGPQLAGGVETSRDLAPGGTPEGLPGDMIGAQHKAESLLGFTGNDNRGVAGSEPGAISEEDIYKSEEVQGNDIKDLHKFLAQHPKFKAKEEEEESERENAMFAESEARAHENIGSINMHNDQREHEREMKEFQNMQNNNRPLDNRSPEKEEKGENEEESHEYDEKEHLPSSHKGHNHHDTKETESSMEPQGLGPGLGMLKPGGPEVPGLSNILGGAANGMIDSQEQVMSGQNIPDMNGEGTGPYGLPNNVAAKFISAENNKNMMESNSDYTVPKTAFSNLWKDYMLTTQSQLAEKDPSANNRHTIHHPHVHHLKWYAKKKRDSVKSHSEQKHENLGKNQSIQRRSISDLSPKKESNQTITTPSNETTQNISICLDTGISKSNECPTASVTNSSIDLRQKNSEKHFKSVKYSYVPKNHSLSGNNIHFENKILQISGSKRNNVKSLEAFRKSANLPPIYLTVKNGKKMLVLHPTAEFLSSLPKINFTESSTHTDKREIATQPKSKTDKAATRGDILHGENHFVLLTDIREMDNEEKDEKNDFETIGDRKNIRHVKNKFVKRDLSKRFDSTGNTQNIDTIQNSRSGLQRDSNFQPENYQNNQQLSDSTLETKSGSKLFKHPSDSLPLPNEIQNLYKQYAPKDKTNFQYEPSRDEVAEELQYAQRENAKQDLGVEYKINEEKSHYLHSGSQNAQMKSFGNSQVNELAPTASHTSVPWERFERPVQEAEGSRKSTVSVPIIHSHIGFGPITVEAKPAK